MEPPSYEEARLHPAAPGTPAHSSVPPPSYDHSFPTPSTPPPTYGEAVQPNPFPVLTPPTVQTDVTSPEPNSRLTIHPVTQIGVRAPVSSSQSVVVTQPQPALIHPSYLRDIPGLVLCPYCHRVVTTKVTYQPGTGAWCMCCLLTMMGLVCGFCLIPLMVRGLQDANHSCPECGNHLHKYRR